MMNLVHQHLHQHSVMVEVMIHKQVRIQRKRIFIFVYSLGNIIFSKNDGLIIALNTFSNIIYRKTLHAKEKLPILFQDNCLLWKRKKHNNKHILCLIRSCNNGFIWSMYSKAFRNFRRSAWSSRCICACTRSEVWIKKDYFNF
jgi:hypothetical protein